MNYTYQHYQIGLTFLNGIGPIKSKELFRSIENLELFFLGDAAIVKETTGLRINFIDGLKRKEALEKAEVVIRYMEEKGLNIVFFTDLNYPRRLKNCPDAPLVLYCMGDGELNPSKIVSVVGTRNASSYGLSLCKELIYSFRDKNITVVSGLAMGIDAAVHRNCLENGVPTFGVLGHGLDRIYPSHHRSLASKMVKNGGLITEFVQGTSPDRENFPKRNRIVAGLSDATIVIESKVRGGSLITANLANDYNRDVFAYPGSIRKETSQGCNLLISSQKASLIQDPNEFLIMMGWNDQKEHKPIQRKLFVDLTLQQKSIVELISGSSNIQIDLLSLKSKIPISQLNSELFNLEMSGVVMSMPGRKYQLA